MTSFRHPVSLSIAMCFLAGMAALVLALTLRAGNASERLAGYAQGLLQKFPDVPVITTGELAALDPAPFLVDARSEKEFAVSRLPGALRAESVAAVRSLGVAPETPVVVYCSVGYRSALLARALREAGFPDVRNLDGSIFAWANEGRPLVDAAGATSGAHPFNRSWGRYLDRTLWRWHPREGKN